MAERRGDPNDDPTSTTHGSVLIIEQRSPSPYPHHTAWPYARPLASGIVLGILSRLADHVGEPLATLGNLGWPWLAVAFLVGSTAPNTLHGRVFGTVTLLIAVVAYYVAMFFVDYGMSLDAIAVIGVPGFVLFWVAVAAVGGPIFGVAGAAWRHHRN